MPFHSNGCQLWFKRENFPSEVPQSGTVTSSPECLWEEMVIGFSLGDSYVWKGHYGFGGWNPHPILSLGTTPFSVMSQSQVKVTIAILPLWHSTSLPHTLASIGASQPLICMLRMAVEHERTHQPCAGLCLSGFPEAMEGTEVSYENARFWTPLYLQKAKQMIAHTHIASGESISGTQCAQLCVLTMSMASGESSTVT